MMKKALLIIVALLAFESFGFGFLLDAANAALIDGFDAGAYNYTSQGKGRKSTGSWFGGLL